MDSTPAARKRVVPASSIIKAISPRTGPEEGAGNVTTSTPWKRKRKGFRSFAA